MDPVVAAYAVCGGYGGAANGCACVVGDVKDGSNACGVAVVVGGVVVKLCAAVFVGSVCCLCGEGGLDIGGDGRLTVLDSSSTLSNLRFKDRSKLPRYS